MLLCADCDRIAEHVPEHGRPQRDATRWNLNKVWTRAVYEVGNHLRVAAHVVHYPQCRRRFAISEPTTIHRMVYEQEGTDVDEKSGGLNLRDYN